MNTTYKQVKVNGSLYTIWINSQYIGDFLMKEDGFFDWWPEFRTGYLPAWLLRRLADELDALNAEWDAQIAKELE